ncbi:hypothetical protein EJB05_22355 [Eragrostis curvula]|uniref:Uncharacterized protein n=1 Tax=Eragrostis curvula TaxID=38414 RepID=A0A5J9V610_9POAL|nr:hypothetical protein EJB05_22355 [Eragrostis curvula]
MVMGGQCKVVGASLLILLLTSLPCKAQSGNLTRGSFPEGFIFGTAASAYQYEGAVKDDGRGTTIWDKFAHTFGKLKFLFYMVKISLYQGKIIDFSNADVAVDQYHRFKEDIQLMADMGMDAYRFSIAWSRIFPSIALIVIVLPCSSDGTGEVNQAGIDHYNNLINALIAKGIEPYVTLYHWDLPQALEDKYNGWLNEQIMQSRTDSLGYLLMSYGMSQCRIQQQDVEAAKRAQEFQLGWFADPFFFGDYPVVMRSRVGNRLPKFTAKEAALVKGSLDFMGINHYTTFYTKDDESTVIDKLLNNTLADTGTISIPFRNGKPIGDRVSSAFSNFIELQRHSITDSRFSYLILHICLLITPALQANSIWLYIVPGSMRSLMNYVKDRYNTPRVFITENGKHKHLINLYSQINLHLIFLSTNFLFGSGMDDANSPFISRKKALKDDKRIKYHNDYLENLAAAISEDGCDVHGYFVWSLLDNWEWTAGYTSRFGLYFVDYKDNLKRYPKNSVQWFKNLLAS